MEKLPSKLKDFIDSGLSCAYHALCVDPPLVDDAIEAQKLLMGGNDHLFYGGSRIIVTSRDKQVLKNIIGNEDQIYEVKGLSKEDGVQLFSLHAFKQNHPSSDFLNLSERVFNYSGGNPLALVVLGLALFDKSKEEWVSAFDELGEEPFPDILKVMRIGYDALYDEEKMIFLDIASFLAGKTWDSVVAYYKGSVKRIEYKVNNLIDKCLITVSKDKKLKMHDLLKEVGRYVESTKKLEERTRIWDFKDVTRISKKTKENSMIEAISIDLSQGKRISEFECRELSKLDGLRFLELYHDAAKKSKVRFRWEGFEGFPDELRYLRWDAYPQKSLPSSFCIENLVELHMPRTTMTELWTGKQNIVNLKVINLQSAWSLVEFPDVSECRNIEEINLSFARGLVKMSPSVQHLPKLKILNLLFGPNVESGPTTFDSKVLETLRLCRGFKIFPRLASGNHTRELNLNFTGIRVLPSSIELLTGLEKLSMEGCGKLSIISTNICKLKSLLTLDLRDCTNLESFPEIMEPMESLESLDLSGCTALKDLPSSIQHLIRLKYLIVNGCESLTSLPISIVNFRNLLTVSANGCVSLKTISSACFASESRSTLKFVNCFNWDEEERRRVLEIGLSNLLYMLSQKVSLEIFLPWSEIPEWFFSNQSIGSSLTLELPMDNQDYTFAFCVVVKSTNTQPRYPIDFWRHSSIFCRIDDRASGFTITSCVFERLSTDVEHLLLWSSPGDDKKLREYVVPEVSLQFGDPEGEVEVTKCAVLILPA